MTNGWHTIQKASRFSANGAASFQPGATPQVRRAPRDRGLKARANRREVRSGFQPSWFWGHETQGVALGPEFGHFLPVSRSETTMVAVGLSPRTAAKHTIRRRGATAERSNKTLAFDRRSATHDYTTPPLRGLKSTATIMASLR